MLFARSVTVVNALSANVGTGVAVVRTCIAGVCGDSRCRGILVATCAAATVAISGSKTAHSGTTYAKLYAMSSSVLNFARGFDDLDTVQEDGYNGSGVIPETVFSDSFFAAGSPVLRGASPGVGSTVQQMLDAAGIQLSVQPFQPVASHTLLPPPATGINQTPSFINPSTMYPHCHRRSTDDFDSFLAIDWNSCTAGK